MNGHGAESGREPRDDELVAGARAGDREALDVLVARHHGVAYRVALGILADPDAAADATQEAFLKAMRGLAGFRGDARFRTWLLTIVSNEARTQLRRGVRRRERSMDEVGEMGDGHRGADELVAEGDACRRARGLLERLPEKQRLAVQLRVDEGLSFREVGEIIGSSEGAARVNYHHGIKRLRAWMEDTWA
ncbi:MAG: RNA polymerase sigma factor [Longimicrobiales bacterium]|nr:RNA polymerase sigma factor [Longimicrobiales bacterium]